MAQKILSEFELIINKQVDEYENLSEYLSKAEALLQVALGEHFLEQGMANALKFLVS